MGLPGPVTSTGQCSLHLQRLTQAAQAEWERVSYIQSPSCEGPFNGLSIFPSLALDMGTSLAPTERTGRVPTTQSRSPVDPSCQNFSLDFPSRPFKAGDLPKSMNLGGPWRTSLGFPVFLIRGKKMTQAHKLWVIYPTDPDQSQCCPCPWCCVTWRQLLVFPEAACDMVRLLIRSLCQMQWSGRLSQ